MTTTLNAVSGTGLVQTSDGSGVVKVQSNGVTTNALAWVNFNGTTSPGTIRSAYNVGSVTKNGTGDYTINFSTALSDANYAALCTRSGNSGNSYVLSGNSATAPTTSAYRIDNTFPGVATADDSICCVAIFGN